MLRAILIFLLTYALTAMVWQGAWDVLSPRIAAVTVDTEIIRDSIQCRKTVPIPNYGISILVLPLDLVNMFFDVIFEAGSPSSIILLRSIFMKDMCRYEGITFMRYCGNHLALSSFLSRYITYIEFDVDAVATKAHAAFESSPISDSVQTAAAIVVFVTLFCVIYAVSNVGSRMLETARYNSRRRSLKPNRDLQVTNDD